MDEKVILGTEQYIDKLGQLYDEINDYLAETINYPQWEKGVYPTSIDAAAAIKKGHQFILLRENEIAGSIVLNHDQPEAYQEVKWASDPAPNQVMTIHTLAVSPHFQRLGIAGKLVAFAKAHAVEMGCVSLRLDTTIINLPAISLYEKTDFVFRGVVDLGLNLPGNNDFKLYEVTF